MKEIIKRKIRLINNLSDMEVSFSKNDGASKYVVFNREKKIHFCNSKKELRAFINGVLACVLEEE